MLEFRRVSTCLAALAALMTAACGPAGNAAEAKPQEKAKAEAAPGIPGGSTEIPPAPGDGSYIGAFAPEITVETAVQGPPADQMTLAALEGKAVVLLFWSTNCPTCDKVLPHVNTLVEALKDEPIQFISLMAQDKATVEEFLKDKMAVNTWIGIDEDHSTGGDYLMVGVPMAIVIDRNRNVAARTQPLNLTVRSLKDIINGRTPPLAVVPVPEKILYNERHTQLPVFEVSLRPSEAETPRSVTRVGGLRVRGVMLREIISMTFENFPVQAIVSETLPLDSKFDLNIIPGHRREMESYEVSGRLLREVFGMTAERVKRPTSVIVLRAPGGLPPVMAPAPAATSEVKFRHGEALGVNVTASYLSYYLFMATGLPVIDETGLAQTACNFHFAWDADRPMSAIAAAREQLGLQVTEETRELELLVVGRAWAKE